MYLKRLKIINYRKFYATQNIIEFVSSKIIKEENIQIEVMGDNDVSETEQISNSVEQIDVASGTTLIIGKNNAGKTTIISALDKLINQGNSFGVNDFNYRYLEDYLKSYNHSKVDNTPFVEFIITIDLEKDSSDRVTNLIPFMLVEDVEDIELDICVRYEIKDAVSFHSKMKVFQTVGREFQSFVNLLNDTEFCLNYYDKNHHIINTDFKLSNLIEIQCIKANNLKNDHCLTDAFNKIINYRYEHVFKNEKKEVTESLEKINNKLTAEIRKSHTEVIENVVKKVISMEHMGVNLSADITFEKLMKDLVKYEYIENGTNIPESQFGLGYTNLVMIIAAIMDYIERYPSSAFNSKINLISIEEPETYMHPQMQELFIKNINEAIRVLLSSKEKNINSQIIITTHSAHILNSKIHSSNTFDNICYLYEEKHNASVRNLNNDIVMPRKGCANSEEFKFLKKHIKYKVSELFFSEAAIFVEGFAEDLLIPFYIEKRETLNKNYISIFNINGAHGFLYRRLVEALGIPVLMITDLDIKRDSINGDESDSLKGKKSIPYKQIDSLIGQLTTNATIIDFYKKDLTDIEDHIETDNLYLAYQGKVNGYYATSFEEAFILANFDNEITNDLLEELKPNIYKSIVGTKKNYSKNIDNSYKWQVKLGTCKGEFASKLLYKLVNEEDEMKLPLLPDYIADGLNWIERKLGGK